MTTKFRTIQSKLAERKRQPRRRLMMQTGVIVVRNAGCYVPNEVLETVLKANPHGWGAAVVDGANGLMCSSDIDPVSIEFIQDSQKSFPDRNMTFYFANCETAMSLADLPPHVLLEKKISATETQPQLVAFIEGNFAGSAQAGSSHPPEYHLVEDYLRPKFQSLYEMVDGDLSKLMEQLKKPHFKKELLLTSVSRGTITIVAANGQTITFDQNDLSASFPWGWMSNHLGLKKADQPPTEAVQQPKRSMFGKSTVREPANVQPSQATTAPVGENTTVAKVQPINNTSTSVIENITVKKWKPESHLRRKERRQSYKNKIGYVPPGADQGVEIEVYVDSKGRILNMNQVKELGLKGVGLPKLNNPNRDEKDLGIDYLPDKEAPPSTPAEPVLPIMSPESRKKIKEILADPKVQKILATNAQQIGNPAHFQQIETKFADFAAQLGVKSMDDFKSWDFSMIAELPRDAVNVMCNTFKNMVIRQGLKAPAVPEVKVEAPPEKRSMFQKKSVA